MKKTRIAINGFGRIGRVVARIMENYPELELVAVNDLTDAATLGYLFKYDSIHGKFKGEVSSDESAIYINGKKITLLKEANPANLPWNELQVDIVFESTGRFTTKETAAQHITAGAKKVIITAPASGADIKSVVMGVNDNVLDGSEEVLSNASCTTNCAAPLVKVLEENFGIESGFISTIHAYTSDQRLHDSPHKDFRRARAAAESMIPTSTGAAKAIGLIFPHLKGKLGGNAVRVPVPDGSLTDMTVVLKKAATKDEINAAFKKASENELKGILEYNEDPIVSCDIIGNSHSSIYDAGITEVIGNMVKLVSWYDNEYGYSNRLVDLAIKISK